jgi:Fe-S-cluster containining protein
MNKAYQKAIEIAIKNQKSNKKLADKLVKNYSKSIDDTFSVAHERVFKEIDCLQCANCCKTTSPIFRDVDIERLSKYLRISQKEFIQQYVHLDTDNDYVLNASPCAFLNEDNTCNVYAFRPKACREYPHTNRKRMAGIMKLTLKNATICPAVALIFESLQQKLK